MKIARIESFILGTGSSKDLLLCRVEVEDGVWGWGEAYVMAGKETVIAECVRAMTPHVIGRGVFNIRHTGQVMFEDFAIRRGSMELLSAWSAIEIASWDIIGKICGQPVYNLLGGPSRERVRIYANGWAGRSTIEEGVERGRKIKAMGFIAAKFDPFPGPWRSYVDRRDEDFAIDYVRAMRAALGPDFEILVEAHRRFAPSHAIRIGNRLAEFNIDWYEEPCLADNIALLAEVRRAVPIPIVTGEALYTKEQFALCLAARAADILNPDICAIGGITALLDICVMAQPHAVVMSPHNYNSPLVGMAATVHVSAVIPNFRITEYFVNFADVCRDIAVTGLEVKDGWIDLPTTPGLGIDIDVAKLRARPHQEASKHGFRQYWEEYPRKDYQPRLAETRI
ncbi:MAG TPA: mandelate racemase/muconate lactonizing enzyme family protein [Stellaceae bacterium]|nr:mandelate racemase/muconate lactonizing enzyme family protein [Stellaceae bacterium]